MACDKVQQEGTAAQTPVPPVRQAAPLPHALARALAGAVVPGPHAGDPSGPDEGLPRRPSGLLAAVGELVIVDHAACVPGVPAPRAV